MKLRNIVCYAALLSCVPAAVFAQTMPTKTVPAKVVYCAVTGEKIGDAKDAKATRVVNGKTYYTCCPGCAPKFDAAPAKYTKIADLRENKRGLEAKLAKVTADLKAAESGKTKFPPTAPKKVTTAAKPAVLHCAVTGEEIASIKDAFGSEEYNGKTYYFCCAGCAPMFKANPAKYAAAADKRDAASSQMK